jgi:integrase
MPASISSPIQHHPAGPAPRAAPAPALTLADLLTRLRDDPAVPSLRKTQVASSLRSFARKAAQAPDDIQANAPALRAALATLHPAAARITPKRLANLRSEVQWAVRRYGDRPQRPPQPRMTPEWAAWFARLADRRSRCGLSRFLRFLSGEGIAPEAVADPHVAAYRAWLDQDQLGKNPIPAIRMVCASWNRAVATIPDWPQRPLTVIKARHAYCLAWTDLPLTLQADVAAWLARLSQADPTDLEAPARPLRPTSLKARRFSLLQAISGMVHQGVALTALPNLAAVVAPTQALQAVRFLLARAGGQPSGQAGTVAGVLLMIARHWVKAPADDLKRLVRLHRMAAPPKQGMTRRNRVRLSQFDSPHNVQALLLLPATIAAALPKAEPLAFDVAHRLQTALVIELLLMVPMRRANLAGLHLDRHLIRQGAGRQDHWTLVIPSHEVKNGEPIEALLPAETARLLELYLRRARPVLNRAGGRWLFPGHRATHPKCPDVLLRQVQTLVRDRLGLEVTLHFFRSLAGQLFLNERPGEYETVRRLLGHRQMETTVTHYVGAEAKAAMQRVDAVILGLRRQARGAPEPAAGPARRRR